MDPSTGTFISSDSYSGSTGNPISLHKYLYANANPVSYSDPSGYISLMEGMLAVGMMSVMYNSISSMLNVYQAGGSDEQAWTAYLDTLINGVAILGVYGCLGTVAVSYIWARAMLSVLDFVFASISLYEAHLAFIEGEIAAGVALTALGLLGMYSSYSNAMWAMQGVTANAANVAATAEAGSSEGGTGSKYEITWNKTINATQEVIEGTNIPKSFTINGLNVNGKEVWVHGNATKHMGEFINSAKGTIIGENELMLSFQETVSQILPEVQSGRNFFNINGWEIGINGDTGVIYHALYK